MKTASHFASLPENGYQDRIHPNMSRTVVEDVPRALQLATTRIAAHKARGETTEPHERNPKAKRLVLTGFGVLDTTA